MLTMTIALGINFCCSTSIYLPLYYNVILCIIGMIQLPKLYICTVQIPRVGIIFVHHEGVMPIVND